MGQGCNGDGMKDSTYGYWVAEFGAILGTKLTWAGSVDSVKRGEFSVLKACCHIPLSREACLVLNLMPLWQPKLFLFAQVYQHVN